MASRPNPFLITAGIMLSIIALSYLFTVDTNVDSLSLGFLCGSNADEAIALLNNQIQSQMAETIFYGEKDTDLTLKWPLRQGRMHILLVSYPSSGEELIRKLVSRMGRNAPTFSVYPEDHAVVEADNIGIDINSVPLWSTCYSEKVEGLENHPCNLSSDFPIIMQTFFPAVTRQSNLPPFDKIIHLVRNPFDNIKSFYHYCQNTNWLASRRRAWEYHIKKEIEEYKKFHSYWDRVARDSGVSYMTVRYEDLCENPAHSFSHILAFLDIIHNSELTSFMPPDCSDYDPISEKNVVYTHDQALSVQFALDSLIEKYDFNEIADKFVNQ